MSSAAGDLVDLVSQWESITLHANIIASGSANMIGSGSANIASQVGMLNIALGVLWSSVEASGLHARSMDHGSAGSITALCVEALGWRRMAIPMPICVVPTGSAILHIDERAAGPSVKDALQSIWTAT